MTDTTQARKLAQEIREAWEKTTPGTYKTVGIRGWTVVAEGAKTIPVADFLPRSRDIGHSLMAHSWGDASFYTIAHNKAEAIADALEVLSGECERLKRKRAEDVARWNADFEEAIGMSETDWDHMPDEEREAKIQHWLKAHEEEMNGGDR